MEQLNRRTFIGGAGVIAVGTALGISAMKGIRRHGPVKLWMHFLSKEPTAIQAELFSDEKRDIFGIRVFCDKGEQSGLAEMPLGQMRRIVDTSERHSKVICLLVGEHGDSSRIPVAVTTEQDKLTFLMEEKGQKPSPIWLSLSDAKRVL